MPFTDEEEIVTIHQPVITRLLLLLSFLCFFLSLFFTAFYAGNGNRDGLESFLYGGLAWWGGSGAICWLANPFLILSWILIFKKKKSGRFFSGVACVLAFSFLLFNEIIDDEAGHHSKILSVGTGYWIWCGAYIFSLLAGLTPSKNKII